MRAERMWVYDTSSLGTCIKLPVRAPAMWSTTEYFLLGPLQRHARTSSVFAEAVSKCHWVYTVSAQEAMRACLGPLPLERKIYVQVAARCHPRSGQRVHFSISEQGTDAGLCPPAETSSQKCFAYFIYRQRQGTPDRDNIGDDRRQICVGDQLT